RLTRFGHAMNEGHHPRDLAAERAGIHHQSAADGAGNSFAEFEAREPARDHRFDQLAEIDARTRGNFDIVDRNFVEALAQPDHQASNAAIADQQVGAMTEAKSRYAGAMRRALRAHQFGFAFDIDEQIRRTADPKRSEGRE